MKRLRNDEGSNGVQIALGLALLAIAYFAWINIPVQIEYMKVKNLVRLATNMAYSDRRPQVVEETIVKGFPEIGMRDREVVDGEVETSKTRLYGEDIEIEWGPNRQAVTATVTYERKIVWPLIKHEEVREYTFSHTEDLSPIHY